jgi:hypothetical protein
MPRRNDHFRREPITGDPARYFWDRTPAQSWFKPDRATLTTQTIPLGDEPGQKSSMDSPLSRLRLLAELGAPRRPELQQHFSTLEFVQDPHWRESAPLMPYFLRTAPTATVASERSIGPRGEMRSVIHRMLPVTT